jgi:hypothetical protein
VVTKENYLSDDDKDAIAAIHEEAQDRKRASDMEWVKLRAAHDRMIRESNRVRAEYGVKAGAEDE